MFEAWIIRHNMTFHLKYAPDVPLLLLKLSEDELWKFLSVELVWVSTRCKDLRGINMNKMCHKLREAFEGLKILII